MSTRRRRWTRPTSGRRALNGCLDKGAGGFPVRTYPPRLQPVPAHEQLAQLIAPSRPAPGISALARRRGCRPQERRSSDSSMTFWTSPRSRPESWRSRWWTSTSSRPDFDLVQASTTSSHWWPSRPGPRASSWWCTALHIYPPRCPATWAGCVRSC